MTGWWVDRVLPGLASSGIWWIALWLSHRKLRGHIDDVTRQQNEHIEQLTTDQTAALTGRTEGKS